MPGESGLHQGFQLVPERVAVSNFSFYVWTALRKMLHKLDYFKFKMGHKGDNLVLRKR